MTYLFLGIFVLLFGGLLFFQYRYVGAYTKLSEREREAAKLQAENADLRLQLENSRLQEAKQQVLYQQLRENKEEQLAQFKILSNDILQAQHQQFALTQQKDLELLLKPFKEQLTEFKTRIETVHSENVRNKGDFDRQISSLLNLNTDLNKSAQNLAEALQGNKKTQGNWGEFQLDRILEISGLNPQTDYSKQETFKDSAGNILRPDVVVNLPDERRIVIDSKVSLNDYLSFTTAETEEEKKVYLKKHVECIKKHITELSAKKYHLLLKQQGLDFVVMFLPVESAYVEAITLDSELYAFAYRHHIILTTPSSLLCILRTVESLWKIEKQNQNVQEIAELGGRLFDKIAGFCEDMNALENSIKNSISKFDSAKNKLATGKGNALSLAERLKKLGAKTTKTLAIEAEDTPLITANVAE